MQRFDQFTRWLCDKCGGDGIDSWNKAIFDGVEHDGDDLPDPWILGCECWRCGWPCVVMYSIQDVAPRAIYSPIKDGGEAYLYEDDALERIEFDPNAAVELQPAVTRDADWSRGCLAARGQLQ